MAASNPVLHDMYGSTPLRALRVTSRKKLSGFLDIEGSLVVCGEEDVVNDYNGLAELAGFTYQNIMNMKRQKSPTTELLEQWTGLNATVGMLWQFLATMERFDVLSDCRGCIIRDCEIYHKQQTCEKGVHLEQDPTVPKTEMHIDETMYATIDDVKTGKRTQYDAFICYTQEDDDDCKFLFELIGKLEKERGLKLFVPGRDDLPGGAEHTITAYLIEKRCRRIVILISRKFLQSAACDFQIKFAQALAPGARSKKLIPVVRHKNTFIPRIVRFLAVCDFSRSDMTEWVWDRLYTAIIAPIGSETYFEADDPSNPFETDESLKHIAYPTHRRMDENKDQSAHSLPLVEAGTTGSVSVDLYTRSEPMQHQMYHSQPSTSTQSHSGKAVADVSMSLSMSDVHVDETKFSTVNNVKNCTRNPTTCSQPSTTKQSQAPTRGNLTSKRAIARPIQQKPIPPRKPDYRRNTNITSSQCQSSSADSVSITASQTTIHHSITDDRQTLV